MMRKYYLFFCLVFLLFIPKKALSWENIITHPTLTDDALYSEGCQIDLFLKNQLGLNDGLFTELEWEPSPIIKKRIKSGQDDYTKTKRFIIEWIQLGSNIEDETLSQFRFTNHFHDPTRNSGLNNKRRSIFLKKFYEGESALDWALNLESNEHNWQITRDIFYQSLTEQLESGRNELLAQTFLGLGHTLHMIEDMSVPSHTRNDSLYAHVRNIATDKGEPLEVFTESLARGRNLYLFEDNWTKTPLVFNRIADYFDTDTRNNASYLGSNINPPLTWGLAEATNYQFLSWSTFFVEDQESEYYFPHPARSNTTEIEEFDDDGYRKYYSGYGVHYLGRKLISVEYLFHDQPDKVAASDRAVLCNYLEITIPRTLNYATGLVNYFFRGRLSVEPNGVDEDGNIEIEIKNTSINTDSEQALVGGTFELYWDNDANERAAVEGFGVDGWSSSSVLDYDETVLARFPVFTPEDTNIVQYVLVYKGPINPSSDPDKSDEDDQQAIAVDMFQTNLGNVVCMCWIDEASDSSSPYNSSSTYNADLQAYRNIISSNDASVIKSGCLVPGNPPSGVLPSGYSAPEEVSIQTCGRPPSQSELTDDFNRIRDGIVPDYLILCVDNSGSMHTVDIESGYSNFKTWIQNNYSSTIIVEYSFTTERWLNEMKNGIQNAIEDLNN